jgi:hypothetical protein
MKIAAPEIRERLEAAVEGGTGNSRAVSAAH